MRVPAPKDRLHSNKDSERALRLKGRSLALVGAWLLNFFLFIAGFSLAFSTGVPISDGRHDQPRVIVNKGDYRQLGTPAYVYIVSHQIATVVLTVIVLPSVAYLELARLTARHEGMNRGAI